MIVSTNIPSSPISLYDTQSPETNNNCVIDESFSIDHNALEISRYKEITRRLSENEKTEIESELSNIQKEDLDLFESALKQGNWDEISKNEKSPYYALKAVKEGLITEQQFATVMFYWTNAQEGTITPIPLFDSNGLHNEEAKDLIRQTLITPPASGTSLKSAHSGGPCLNEKQLDELFDKMRELPESEKNIFLVDGEKSQERTIMDIIIDNLGVNIFARTTKGRIFPSCSLVQTFLNVKFGDDAVTLNPVLALSSLADIRENGLTSTRDMALHFPGVYLPDEADGNPAPGFTFTFHDIYHGYMASSIGDHFRRLFIEVGDIADKVFKELPQEEQLDLAERCYDMEMPEFRHEALSCPENRSYSRELYEEKMNDCFWQALYMLYGQAKAAKNLGSLVSIPSTPPLILPISTESEIEALKKIASLLPLNEKILKGPEYVFGSWTRRLNQVIDSYKLQNNYNEDYFGYNDYNDDEEYDDYDGYSDYSGDEGYDDYSNAPSTIPEPIQQIRSLIMNHPLLFFSAAWMERTRPSQQKMSV